MDRSYICGCIGSNFLHIELHKGFVLKEDYSESRQEVE